VACTPGKLYSALATVKAPASTALLCVDMQWYDSGGVLLSSTQGPSLLSDSTLRQIYGNGVAPTGATKVGFRIGYIRAQLGANSAFYVDKCSVHPYAFQEWAPGGQTVASNWRPVHLYDLCERVAGDVYACGPLGVTGAAGVLRTQNGGTTWALAIESAIGTTLRFYDLGALNGVVYTVLGDTINGGSPQEVYVHDKGEQCYTWNGSVGGRGPVLNGFIHPQNFIGRLVYRGSDNMLRSFNGTTVFTHRSAKLHTIDGAKCIIVDGTTVYSSPDLAKWTEIGSAPSNATSICVGPDISGGTPPPSGSSLPLGGVAVHMTYTNTIYNNGQLAADKLALLEAKMARDEWPVLGQSTQYYTNYYARLNAIYNTAGTKFVIIPCNPGGNIDAILDQMEPYIYLLAGIEGPNEWNHNSGVDWESELTAHVQSLWNKVRARPAFNNIPIIGPSIFNVDNVGVQVPSYAQWVNKGNLHYYARQDGINTRDLGENIDAANVIFGNKELWVTETGALYGDTYPGTEEGQGTYYELLMQLMGERGVKRAFCYELFNGSRPKETATHHENNFGCYRTDGSAKPLAAKVLVANRRG
jgi:hypothetical protein